MRLDEDFDEQIDFSSPQYERGRKNSMRSAAIMAGLFVFLTIMIVLAVNREESRGGSAQVTPAPVSDYYTDPKVGELISGSERRAEDLNFWDAYSTPSPAEKPAEAGSESAWGNIMPDDSITPAESEKTEESTQEETRTRIVLEDGSEQWVDINPYLARHGYDLSGLVYQKPFMQYYVNGTKKSFSGADISKEQGTVDFKRMKKAGVDYVMLRLGQRGYTTGEISLDDSFIVNYTAARDAGLDIGVYFVSSAISPEEAAEEADFCLETISVNEITLEYPIAISAEKLGDGRSRCDDLEKMPRTNCALAFMNRIEEKGYLSLLKADKATLITKYSLGSMIGYDIWYVGKEDIPDFPYPFVMWQYDDAGELSGVEGGVHLDMSFMDYSVR